MNRYWLYNVWEWVKDELPTFDKETSRQVRKMLVAESGDSILLITFMVVLVFLPAINYLKLTDWFFKIEHRIQHHIFKRYGWIHRSKIYHNKALQICVAWGILAFGFVFFDSNKDLMVVTKRLGRIPVSLMPTLLFLTMRPSPLPHTLYLSSLPLHKWISRIVVLQSFMHTILYLTRYYYLGTLWKLKKMANVWGILAMILFLTIGVTSLPRIRRYNFQLFYFVHYTFTWVSIAMLQFHARPDMNLVTTLNVIILAAQALYRVWNTSLCKISVINVSPSISVVEFPLKCLRKKPIFPSGHVRINDRHPFWLKRWIYHVVPFQHPFTIASLPTEPTVRLIVRTGRFPLRTNSEYYITGVFEPKCDFLFKPSKSNISSLSPFQSSTPMLLTSPLAFNVHAKRVLMVVGGSGISFGLPMLRILNFNGVNVRLIWVTRDYRDMQLLNVFKNNYNGLEIYVTGTLGSEQDLQIDYIDYGPDVFGLPQAEGSSSQTEQNLLSKSSRQHYGSLPNTRVDNCTGTPPPVKENEDEFDFTNLFSASNTIKRSKSDPHLGEIPHPFDKNESFRKPKVIVPPNDDNYKSDVESLQDADMKLNIPSGVKVIFGRPQLSQSDYEWCLQKECIGPSETNECCARGAELDITHVDDLAKVWVVAVGPKGLIESTRRWATDGGLHFHEESFSL